MAVTSKAGKSKLTAKQIRFCEEYLVDHNATQAAIRAKYSEKTARQSASENLSKPNIQEYLQQLRAEQSKRTEIDADWILETTKKVVLITAKHEKYSETLKGLGLLGKWLGMESLQIKHEEIPVLTVEVRGDDASS